MSKKEILDRLQSKWISRKLLAFIVASIALFKGTLTSSDWVIITTVYIGVQAATDIVKQLTNNSNATTGE